MANRSKQQVRDCNVQPSSSTTTSSWRYYLFALAPIPLLFFASHFLRNAISSPPSDYGTGSMFDLIAERYDFINRALALNLDMSWRHRLVKEVVGAEGEIFAAATREGGAGSVKILDLATGTADVAILLGKAAAQYYNTHSIIPSSEAKRNVDNTILGLDPSQNMLNVGVTKIQQSNLSHIVRLQLGDARNLDSIANDTFDAATMSFGIRNIPEKEMALCEIHRVLKTSTNNESKLAIMEFSEPGPDTGIMGSLARLFIRHIVPAIGAMLSGCPKEYMHLQKSIKDFPSPPEFVALMEGLQCPIKADSDENDDAKSYTTTFGSFRVKEVVNLNFGSVQIYVATPILKKYVTE